LVDTTTVVVDEVPADSPDQNASISS